MRQHDQALAVCRAARARGCTNEHLVVVVEAATAILEARWDDGRKAVDRLLAFPGFSDPEGYYYWASCAAGLRDHERALQLLSRAVDTGFNCVRGLETTPLFDPIRLDRRFLDLTERARAGHVLAARAFTEAGGHELLGLPLA
jgi:hypothetical protein